jgi:hypothetical protein
MLRYQYGNFDTVTQKRKSNLEIKFDDILSSFINFAYHWTWGEINSEVQEISKWKIEIGQ